MAIEQTKLCDVEFGEVKHETEKAYLLTFGDKDVWVPKSMCDLDTDDKIVTMPEWMAVEKGLV